ncbi:MAG TPA: hypothetical protein PLL09_10745 [Flavobacterium sp.]|uniref:hypothetical protein n=1 Tax=unclassified Flavobacterium TaxID=196869 RepID=UPI0025BC5D72|nr:MULTISPECIES: hypothetical protein [unclassified Flavobacterium]HRE78288.1 hypothetical protein [Flavobacterium sp.]
MKIQYIEPIIKFDINNDAITQRIPCGEVLNYIEEQIGVENAPKGHIWIRIYIQTEIYELASKKIVLHYEFAFTGFAVPNTKEKDANDILSFVKNTLISHQMYFQENAPKEISDFQLIDKPNYELYVKNMMDVLIRSGVCYQQ